MKEEAGEPGLAFDADSIKVEAAEKLVTIAWYFVHESVK